jgi:hypothetical protein
MIDALISAAALCAPMVIVAVLCGAVALCETVGERFGKRRFQRWEDDRRA